MNWTMNNENHHNHQTTHLSVKFPKVAQLQICFNLAPYTPLDMIWSKGRYLHSHFLFIEILFQNLLKDSVVDGYPLHIWLDLVTFRQPEKQDRTWNLKGKTWKSGRNGRPRSLGDPSARGELLSWHQSWVEGRGLICKRNSQPTALRIS